MFRQEGAPRTHQSVPDMSRNTGIRQSSTGRIIHDLFQSHPLRGHNVHNYLVVNVLSVSAATKLRWCVYGNGVISTSGTKSAITVDPSNADFVISRYSFERVSGDFGCILIRLAQSSLSQLSVKILTTLAKVSEQISYERKTFRLFSTTFAVFFAGPPKYHAFLFYV